MEAATWPRELKGPVTNRATARTTRLMDLIETYCAFTPHTQEKEDGTDKDFFKSAEMVDDWRICSNLILELRNAFFWPVHSDRLFKIFMRFSRLFRAFLEWALPDLARHIDFECFELVNKERFTLSGAKREGDVLVKTRLRTSEAAFLFHLENQIGRAS